MAVAHSRGFQEISNRIAPPSHRHAAPSDPFPWLDIQDDGEYNYFFFALYFSIHPQFLRQVNLDYKQFQITEPPAPYVCDHQDCNDCWKRYPQSLFPNWTPAQLKKSKLTIAIKYYRRDVACIIHYVDLDHNGYFIDAGKYVATESTMRESWDRIKFRVSTTSCGQRWTKNLSFYAYSFMTGP